MIKAILLAAGQSKRLKSENKLIKLYKNKPLINYSLNVLTKSKVNKIIIVLGHQHKELKKIIKKKGLFLQEGGRVIHLTDRINKAKALQVFVRFFKKNNKNVKTIAVGDNYNDLEMLKTADFPCLVFNDKFTLDEIPIKNLITTNEPSPEGWADVIKIALAKINQN